MAKKRKAEDTGSEPGFNTNGLRKSMALTDIKPPKRNKIQRALSGAGLSRDLQPFSEHFYANPNEPIIIIEKEASTVNHAHQDTWNGVKKFTHYRRRNQRRP